MRAVKYFEKMGLTTERAKIKNFHNSTEIGMTGITTLNNFPYLMTSGNKPPSVKDNLTELFKSVMGKSKYTKEALIFELMRSTNGFMRVQNNAKYKEEAKLLKQEVIVRIMKIFILFSI